MELYEHPDFDYKDCLQKLIDPNIKEITLYKNINKPTGYLGIILFINAETETARYYNFTIKCSKTDEFIRQKSPVLEAFNNEIHMYSTVFSTFQQFQTIKSIRNHFNSYPKYFGSQVNINRELIVLENLIPARYKLWDKGQPMPSNYMNIVLQEYGKFHAISVAMKEEQPDNFRKLTIGFVNIWQKLDKEGNMTKLLVTSIDDACRLLKNQMNEKNMAKLEKLKLNSTSILKELNALHSCLKVIVHGDAWNDNIMFQETGSNVAFLDFQASHVSSPTFDLAYFIYCCAPRSNLLQLEKYLRIYYNSFSQFLKQLGGNVDIYTFQDLLNDWIRLPCSKFGIIMGIVAAKYYQGNDISKKTSSPEQKKTFENIDSYTVMDETSFINNVKLLIEHAVERCII